MHVRRPYAWTVVTLILSAVGSLAPAWVVFAQTGSSSTGPRLFDPNATTPNRAVPPVPEPPSTSRDLPLPPLPSPPATTREIPNRRPSLAPIPDSRFSTPQYSSPQRHESLRVPPPPDYGLTPSQPRSGYSPGIVPSVPRYDDHGHDRIGPAPAAIPTRSYGEIARTTEKLAKQVREVHLHLHYRGQIVPVATEVNNAREALESMKRMQKAGMPIASIQAGYLNFVGQWQYLQDRIGVLAAHDPGLQQVINVTNAYDAVLRQFLGYQ